MALLYRQTLAQVNKNLTINFRRHWISTFYRSWVLPVIFVGFIAFSRYLFVRPAEYGIGEPARVLDLAQAMGKHPDKPLVFVTGGLDVDEVIQNVRDMAPQGRFLTLDTNDELRVECRQSLVGVSGCLMAVVFEETPMGDGGRWRYTMRGDSALGMSPLVAKDHDNDVQE